jgi:hypothetical protein
MIGEKAAGQATAAVKANHVHDAEIENLAKVCGPYSIQQECLTSVPA